MTFSIAARCPRTGMFGVAIASSSPAVAARCAHARPGAGAVATQNLTDPALGPLTLGALAEGQSADAALRHSLSRTPFGDYRQLVVIGAEGLPVIHSGSKALGVVGSAIGAHSAAAGNLLSDTEVPAAMVRAFESAVGHLGARLLQALQAGYAPGGEAGPIHSAGLLVVREVSWPIVDLRIDWIESQPVEALRDLWDIYEPQIEDYVRRGVDPSQAPNFGVAGDL
jgi:uncharacterized Ntn-hydrolase superfamily protein